MTIERVIEIGDALKQLQGERMPDGNEREREVTANWPVFTDLKGVKELFGIGEATMRALLRANADAPMVRVGVKILVDVYAFRDWLRARYGERISVEEG